MDGEGVEFLEPEPEPGPGGEEPLGDGPRRTVSPWLIGVIAAVVIAAVVIVVIGRGDGTPVAGPSAAPTPAHSEATIAAPTEGWVEYVPSSGAPVVPPPYPQPSDGFESDGPRPVQAIAATLSAGPGVVTLAPGRMTRFAADGTTREVAARLPREVGDVQYAPWRLLTDGNGLWAVGLGGGRVYLIYPGTLTLARMFRVDEPLTGAAVLDGRLYLLTAHGLSVVGPRATRLRAVRGVAGGRAIAADRARHRLLILGGAGRTSVLRAYDALTGRVSATSPRLQVSRSSLVVRSGSIWAGLVRIDPATLRRIGTVTVARQLGAGARVVATGGHGVWVRAAKAPAALTCLTPAGAIAQQWDDTPGMIAAGGGRAYVAHDGTITPLHLNRACRGY